MPFKLDPPAAPGEYEEAKAYYQQNGLWEDVKNESIDGMVYFYRWRQRKKSWGELLKEASHKRGELWPPMTKEEEEDAINYFKALGVWDDVKHQAPEGLVYCYRWRHAGAKD